MMEPLKVASATVRQVIGAGIFGARPFLAVNDFAAADGKKLNADDFIPVVDSRGDCWLWRRIDEKLLPDFPIHVSLQSKRGVVR